MDLRCLCATLCLLWVSTASINASVLAFRSRRSERLADTVNQNDNLEIAELEAEIDNHMPICYPNEPCKFGVLRRTTERYEIKTVDSWCRCADDLVCVKDHFAQRKKANIYTCKVVTTKRHGKRKGKGRRKMLRYNALE